MKSYNIQPNRLKIIIKLYREQVKIYTDNIKKLMRRPMSMQIAIIVACESEGLDGNREPHQYRIPRRVLEKWRNDVLAREDEIENAGSFEELFQILEKVAGKIKGVGPLLTYDTADKLRVYKRLKLDKIYLHAGTRTGARLLLGRRLGKSLVYSDLPAVFRQLPYEDLENLFCICKNLLDSSINDRAFQRQFQDFRHKFLQAKNC